MARILLFARGMATRLHHVLRAAVFLVVAGGAAFVLSPGDGRSAPPVAAPALVTPVPHPPSNIVRQVAAPPPVPRGALTPWELGLLRVQEVRGSGGRITVPDALRHEEDRRRFLAVQMADASAGDYELPHDTAALAAMILRGEVVELPALGDGFMLYDLGEDARDDPLQHFDEESGDDVPLLGPEGYAREDARLAVEEAGRGPAAARAAAERRRLAAWYGDPARSRLLHAEHEAVRRLASDFGGLSYDLADPIDRGRFKVRLLSFARPEARDVIARLARAYHERFARPLPVTSLIRTQRYQRRLGRVNRNATTVDVAPHTTGMAFDVSYKHMPPDEQNLVMEEVARLEAAGRVEALRERRNHLHVYALGHGRPDESRVARFLPVVEAAHPGSAPRRAEARPARAAARRAR
jgi:hypothetical protein